MHSQYRCSLSVSLGFGLLAGVAGYLLMLLGTQFLPHTTYALPSPEFTNAYAFFLLVSPIGTILTLGIPITLFAYRGWIGPILGLGLVIIFWILVSVYSGDATPFGIAPAFWIGYLLIYAVLTVVIDVHPRLFRCSKRST